MRSGRRNPAKCNFCALANAGDLQAIYKESRFSLFGLAASVWTRDLTVAHKTVRDLEAGVIWVNCFDHGDMTQPFGGYKQSGQGRDKCVESLISYTQTKSAWINLGS